MSTTRLNYSSRLLKSLVQDGLFSDEPFVLFDVGASGGIADVWRQFEPSLRAFGFDPLIRECARLNQNERNARVRYYDGFVGYSGYQELLPPAITGHPTLGWTNQPLERTSSAKAQELLRMSSTQRYNNDDPEIALSENRFSIDEFVQNQPVAAVDFIKVDTDGHDYEVLVGAANTLRDKGVLGLFVECQFHGVTHPHANLMANIDRLLRESGFSLFDLEVRRYTRAALPGHFVYTIPAETHEGQVLWGDALYLRDISAPGYDERWQTQFAAVKLLKLASLFEIFGMPDCAAELLLARQEALRGIVNVEALLDVLAGELDPRFSAYRQHDDAFQSAPSSFFPVVTNGEANEVPTVSRNVLQRLLRRIKSPQEQ